MRISWDELERNCQRVWWRFFFSSRRRHTRCSRDWSSDVCSSDLPEKVDSAWRPELSEMVVRLVRSDEQRRYQQLMRAHHYLGYLPKIGETLWYVATWRDRKSVV